MNDEEMKEKKGKSIFIIPLLLIILAAFAIPLLIDRFIFGNGYPSHITNGEWASFLGSFLGGIATMLSVVFTIRYSEKQRVLQETTKEHERKIEKRSYLDLMYHMKATMNILREDYVPDKAKTVYLFNNESPINDDTYCTVLQIMVRSGYLIHDVSILLQTIDHDEKEHQYESGIPFISPGEYVFVVMPKATYTMPGGRFVKEALAPESKEVDERVSTITIHYKTEAGEQMDLVVTNGKQYDYTIKGQGIFSFSSTSECKCLVPTIKKDCK